MKLAVIGSGAAAHAVLAEIRRKQPTAKVDVFDAAEPDLDVEVPTDPREYGDVYRSLKRRQGLRFPPLKSHFGTEVDSRPQAQFGYHWQRPGGLTNYWGATCLPFSDAELLALGLSRQLLDPYYERVAKLLKIAGDADSPFALRHQHHFIRAAAASRLPLFDKLDAVVNSEPVGRFAAGSNCIALDTAPESPTSCTYCGHCLAGCYRQALFCSASEVARRQQVESLQLCEALVQRIDLAEKRIHYLRRGSLERSKPYDRIFLAAGCVQSTAIALRSIGLQKPVHIYDNAIVQFPILYTGPAVENPDSYFSLSQTLVSCSESGTLLQVYPFADHLLRAAVPEFIWPAVKPLSWWLRGRLLVARLYLNLDNDCTHAYTMELRGGEVSLRASSSPDHAAAKPVIAALASHLRDGDFRVLGALKAGARTSSHYASTLTDVAGVSVQTGELAEQVYCCDGSLFRFSSTLSPTFSIMANATRIAEAAL